MGGYIAEIQLRVLKAGTLIAENEGGFSRFFPQPAGQFPAVQGDMLSKAAPAAGGSGKERTVRRGGRKIVEVFGLFPNIPGMDGSGTDDAFVKLRLRGTRYTQAAKAHVLHGPADRPKVPGFRNPAKDDRNIVKMHDFLLGIFWKSHYILYRIGY
jgi:hypothetical protein